MKNVRGDGRLVWLDEEIVIMSAGFGLCSRFLLVAVAVVVQYEETGEGGNGEFDGAVMKKKRREGDGGHVRRLRWK